MVVIDANVAVRFALPNPDQPSIQQQFQKWIATNEMIYAPTLWAYETTSALTKGVRFGQLTADEAQATLSIIGALPVELVTPTSALREKAFDWTLKLNHAAVYDSFYLALAEQLQCQLFTGDKKLVNATAAAQFVQLI